MANGIDREYYERRLREERARAASSKGAASAAHGELAAAYERVLSEARAGPLTVRFAGA